jgi:transcription elongation GreA/GreB family factor
MSIAMKIQDLLAKGQHSTIEEEWLTRLEEDPHDLEYFLPVARTLGGQGAGNLAKNLLDMLYDHLAKAQGFRTRLNLLKGVGSLLHTDGEQLHEAVLKNLEGLYGSGPSFKGLLENVGLHRAAHDVDKTWEKVQRLETLVAFELGEVVFMDGKGVGRVVEVNLQLQSFRVELSGGPKIAVGFRAAPKLLKRLPREHFLHRKVTSPAELARLAKENPSELLRILLESHGQPLTAAEVKRDLAGLVSESSWNSWWTTARKHQQVVATTGSRQTYAWAASNEAALSSLFVAFDRADTRKKIDLYRRDGARDATLRQRMEGALAHLAARALATDPSLALEIGLALDREGRQFGDEAWAPAEILADRPDPRAVILGIEDRSLRERAYVLLREMRKDWPQQYAAALSREEEPKSLELLASALVEADAAAFDRALDTILSQPSKSPGAFLWLAERAARDEAIRAKSPLRLFQQILNGLGVTELAPYRVRLLALFDSGQTVPRLLQHLSSEEAVRAAESVSRAGSLEGYQRDDLMRALEMRFPALRGAPEEAPLYGLPANIKTKQLELQAIVEKEIPVNRKAIEEARAMGDLRENFEYKSARQRHEYLTARATELKNQLSRSRPLDLATVEPDEVRIGTTVDLTNETGEVRTLSILGPWESDPDAGIISYESELGQSLLGKKDGDVVPVGGEPLTLSGIRVYQA